jgi:transposase-like protein
MTPPKQASSANPRSVSFEEYQKLVNNLKTSGDVMNFAKALIAPALQTMLDAELSNHLGYEHSEQRPKDDTERNYRNGHSTKTLKTSFGAQKIAVPRDRDGSFEPKVVRRYETVQNDIEEKIVAMYARGLTTRDINGYLQDIYGVEVSADSISGITDKVLPLVKEWQTRPLSSVFPFVYLDGIHFKVRDSGRIVSKCAYVLLGVNDEGRKEIMGMYVAHSEGAKFWMQVLTEIKNRGVKDILICCIDGLTGFPEAIRAIYPTTVIQHCLVHQVRSTAKYVSHAHKDQFCQDLKTIYTAPTEETGFSALQAVQQKWPQYQAALKSWETAWNELSPIFNYPSEIRHIIYTTNTIESLNRQFRKVTKTTTIFPHDDSLLKLLWLAQENITRKWTMPVSHWGTIHLQLAVLFPGRITIS